MVLENSLVIMKFNYCEQVRSISTDTNNQDCSAMLTGRSAKGCVRVQQWG